MISFSLHVGSTLEMNLTTRGRRSFNLFPSFSSKKFPAFFLGETKISDEKRNKIYEAFGYLEKFLEGRKWLCGDNLTVADLQILSSVSSIVVRSIKTEELLIRDF